MANVSRPSGLSPVGYLNGAAWNGQARTYYIPSADTNAFAIGDPVVLAGSADANGVPSVTLATVGSGALTVGPIVGIGEQEDVIGNINTPNTIIAPATKARAYYVLVADDPNIIFEIQEGGTGTALAATSVGLNADYVSAANNGYLSGWMFDGATTTTGSGYQLKLLGLARRSDNAFGTYAKWLVLINSHMYRPPSIGL